MKDIIGRIINFEKRKITNEKTGEVKIMYFINFEVGCIEEIEGHYGPMILTSCASEDSFQMLKNNIGKQVKIDIADKKIYGKSNQYKKVVSKINGVNIRNF